MQRLRDAYRAAVPRDSARAIADRAMAAGESTAGLVPSRRSSRVVAATGVVGIAAALTLFVVTRRGRVTVDSPVPAVSVADSTSIAVEVPPDRNAIVFATKNPNISVVWIY